MNMIFQDPVPCPNCGKKAKKMTENFWSFDGDDYTGNLRVLMDKSEFKRDEDGNPTGKITRLVLWDGESYVHMAGHFCTKRCAYEFGNQCWETYLKNKGDI